jgi:signal peptidase II
MRRKYLILFSLSGLVLCCDQWVKTWIRSHLLLGDARSVIPSLFSIVHTHNNGFAFGLLKKAPHSLQNLFFVGVPIFALILIILIFIKLQDNQLLTSIALTTILGGAVGNLIDRLHYGYVIDFMDFHFQNRFHLPGFNLADFSIVTGVTMMFLSTLLQEKAGEAEER